MGVDAQGVGQQRGGRELRQREVEQRLDVGGVDVGDERLGGVGVAGQGAGEIDLVGGLRLTGRRDGGVVAQVGRAQGQDETGAVRAEHHGHQHRRAPVRRWWDQRRAVGIETVIAARVRGRIVRAGRVLGEAGGGAGHVPSGLGGPTRGAGPSPAMPNTPNAARPPAVASSAGYNVAAISGAPSSQADG